MGFFSNLKRSYQEKKAEKAFRSRGVETYGRSEQPRDPNFIGSNYTGKFKQAVSSAGTSIGSGIGATHRGAITARGKLENAAKWYAEKKQSYDAYRLKQLQTKSQIMRERAQIARYRQQSSSGYSGLNALFGGQSNTQNNPLRNLDSLMSGRPQIQPKQMHRPKRRGGGRGARRIIIVR